MYLFIILLVIILSTFCMICMIYKLLTKQDQYPAPTFKQSLMLAFTGIVAFVADTIGVGSFAINIALGKTLKLVKDAEIPGFLSGAQVIPGAIEAVFFLEVLHVDVITLVVLVLGATIGGFIGGIFASKISTAAIRLIMIFAFIVVMFLLMGKLLHILPIGGTLVKLTGYKLVLGFMGMLFAGFLVCFGVGFFALVQVILLLLGMSPFVAFPIMTAAGAVQQPITTFVFAINNTIPLRKVLIVGIFGIVGVFIGVHIITALSIEQLQWLLIFVIGYNIVNLSRSYFNDKK